MVIKCDQLSLMIETRTLRNFLINNIMLLESITNYFNYSLFAGQEVFPDAKEILPILSQTFDETFLKKRGGKIKVHL